ncbi:MAG: tRNA pseudouridine(55) synthase TruB [Bacteroidetes bacterium SW_11_45_7]|nr:MAG: tRNA pseudouridine(55) synthase TruB [Bacteroidetes bacterium SW_11_45_7]
MKFNFQQGETLLIDKPKGMTSFDVVKKVRSHIHAKKVGHAGTLDPMATGLLVICTGRATKTIDQYKDLPKEYTGTITLGAITPSYDAETEVSETYDVSAIDQEAIYHAAEQLTGSIQQLPPAYSAVKIGGERSYKKARRGEDVQPQPRDVVVHTFEISDLALPYVHFRIECSKGTYIRTLAYDFGRLLDNGGYLNALRRTRIGSLTVEDAWTLKGLISTIQENNSA